MSYPGHSRRGRVLTPLQNAVGVFYSSSRLGKPHEKLFKYEPLKDIRGAYDKFPAFFFVQAFTIAIHLMRWFQLQMNSYSSNWKYTLLKPWLSQLVNFKNAIWHFRRTICNKILFLKLENATENEWNASDYFSTILYESSISFLSSIRDSRKGRESVRDDERCGSSKEVNRPELLGQRVRVRVTMLRVLREVRKKHSSHRVIGIFHSDNAAVYVYV